MAPKDILFIVLSISIAALTATVIWFLIEMIRIVRGVSRTISTIEGHLQRVDEVIRLVQQKIHDITTAVMGLTNVMGGVMNFVQKRRRRSKASDDE